MNPQDSRVPALSRWIPLAVVAGVLMAGPVRAQTTPEKAKSQTGQAQPGPAPTLANVPYGEHPRQVLDFYEAATSRPTPLVVYIHGGGWVNGDKSGVNKDMLKRLLGEGIAVAAINYRFVTQAQEAGIRPPVRWPLEDAARAIQFL